MFINKCRYLPFHYFGALKGLIIFPYSVPEGQAAACVIVIGRPNNHRGTVMGKSLDDGLASVVRSASFSIFE